MSTAEGMKAGDAPQAPEVRPARGDEWRRLGALLGDAFQDDPMWCWVCPDPVRRRRHLGTVFAQLIRPRVEAGHTFTNVDRSGVSVWAPPGAWKTSPEEMVRMVVPLLRSVGLRNARSRVGALSAMEQLHPTQPHWYLEVLGADPSLRGRGIGSSVIAPMLDRCDDEGMPAYLESSNEANVPLYRRFGFEVTDEQRLAPDAPPIWLMWRDPR